MLKVSDLHVSYGRITALRGVSLSVGEGEIVGLIGPNGAGKSTLLMSIMGVVGSARGTIEFEGRPLIGEAPERNVRHGLVLVPEGRRIFATLTVDENLVVATSGRRDREIAGDIARLYERFPILQRFRRTPAGRLSGGEQQQLAIARALVGRPRLLLLDEPSLGLAPLMVDLVFDALEELRNDGVTIFLVEQNALRTLGFADRTYVLRTGVIELERKRGDRRESDLEVQSLYLGGASSREEA